MVERIWARSALPDFACTSIRVPPLKSMPKFSPWKKYRKMARIKSAAEIGKLTRRKRMKSNLVSSGTMRRRGTAVSFVLSRGSDRHVLGAAPAHPIGDDQAGHR